jgi:hypothetical protein
VLRCVNIDSFLVATVGILVTILKMVVSREYCHDLTMSERASFAGFDPWLLHPRAGSPAGDGLTWCGHTGRAPWSWGIGNQDERSKKESGCDRAQREARREECGGVSGRV